MEAYKELAERIRNDRLKEFESYQKDCMELISLADRLLIKYPDSHYLSATREYFGSLKKKIEQNQEKFLNHRFYIDLNKSAWKRRLAKIELYPAEFVSLNLFAGDFDKSNKQDELAGLSEKAKPQLARKLSVCAFYFYHEYLAAFILQPSSGQTDLPNRSWINFTELSDLVTFLQSQPDMTFLTEGDVGVSAKTILKALISGQEEKKISGLTTPSGQSDSSPSTESFAAESSPVTLRKRKEKEKRPLRADPPEDLKTPREINNIKFLQNLQTSSTQRAAYDFSQHYCTPLDRLGWEFRGEDLLPPLSKEEHERFTKNLHLLMNINLEAQGTSMLSDDRIYLGEIQRNHRAGLKIYNCYQYGLLTSHYESFLKQAQFPTCLVPNYYFFTELNRQTAPELLLLLRSLGTDYISKSVIQPGQYICVFCFRNSTQMPVSFGIELQSLQSGNPPPIDLIFEFRNYNEILTFLQEHTGFLFVTKFGGRSGNYGLISAQEIYLTVLQALEPALFIEKTTGKKSLGEAKSKSSACQSIMGMFGIRPSQQIKNSDQDQLPSDDKESKDWCKIL